MKPHVGDAIIQAQSPIIDRKSLKVGNSVAPGFVLLVFAVSLERSPPIPCRKPFSSRSPRVAPVQPFFFPVSFLLWPGHAPVFFLVLFVLFCAALALLFQAGFVGSVFCLLLGPCGGCSFCSCLFLLLLGLGLCLGLCRSGKVVLFCLARLGCPLVLRAKPLRFIDAVLASPPGAVSTKKN